MLVAGDDKYLWVSCGFMVLQFWTVLTIVPKSMFCSSVRYFPFLSRMVVVRHRLVDVKCLASWYVFFFFFTVVRRQAVFNSLTLSRDPVFFAFFMPCFIYFFGWLLCTLLYHLFLFFSSSVLSFCQGGQELQHASVTSGSFISSRSNSNHVFPCVVNASAIIATDGADGWQVW